MNLIKNEKFSLGKHTFPFTISPDYFQPNKTTELFVEAMTGRLKSPFLDMGAGLFPLSAWALFENNDVKVYASEKVPEQRELGKQNIENLASLYHCKNILKRFDSYCGSWFDSLPSPNVLTYATISGDLSGIANDIGRHMGWYNDNVPAGGLDGTEVIIPFLERVRPYLSEGGSVFFPIAIGFSDHEKIMDCAEKYFRKLEKRIGKINEKTKLRDDKKFIIPPDKLPGLTDLKSTYTFLKNLKNQNSRTFWEGQIYEATDPII